MKIFKLSFNLTLILLTFLIQPCLPYTGIMPSLNPILPNTYDLRPITLRDSPLKLLPFSFGGDSPFNNILDPNRTLPSVLAETNSSGRITSYYVYGLGLISKIEPGIQPHEVNKITDNPGPEDGPLGTAYFYQYDGIGSTVALTDKNGNIKNKYAYDDFGNLAVNSTETVANPFKYVGKFGVVTDLPDLLYMRARYYMPSVGRFINKDPIGLAGGLNQYIYVNNNAIKLIDPSGLSSTAACLKQIPADIGKDYALRLLGTSLGCAALCSLAPEVFMVCFKSCVGVIMGTVMDQISYTGSLVLKRIWDCFKKPEKSCQKK